MNGIGFDAVARRAAAVVSRRTSLLALGGLALGAATQSAPVGANKKKKKKKDRDDNGNQRCQNQKQQCLDSVEDSCNDNVPCENACKPCCDSLATCDAATSTTFLLDCAPPVL